MFGTTLEAGMFQEATSRTIVRRSLRKRGSKSNTPGFCDGTAKGCMRLGLPHAGLSGSCAGWEYCGTERDAVFRFLQAAGAVNSAGDFGR
jgi:hypothetical protein